MLSASISCRFELRWILCASEISGVKQTNTMGMLFQQVQNYYNLYLATTKHQNEGHWKNYK